MNYDDETLLELIDIALTKHINSKDIAMVYMVNNNDVQLPEPGDNNNV